MPGVHSEILAEKVAERTLEEVAVMSADPESMTPKQVTLKKHVKKREQVSHQEIVARAPHGETAQIKRITSEMDKVAETLRLTRQYRGVTNYPYWELRCKSEATETGRMARNALYHARRLKSVRRDDETSEK